SAGRWFTRAQTMHSSYAMVRSRRGQKMRSDRERVPPSAIASQVRTGSIACAARNARSTAGQSFAHSDRMLTIQRILVPTDFSEMADVATDYAVALALPAGAEITLVHAYETPTYGYSYAVLADMALPEKLRVAAGAALQAATDRCKKRGVKVNS